MALRKALKEALRVSEGSGEPWPKLDIEFLESKNFRVFGDRNQWAKKELAGWVLQFRNWYPGRVEYSVSFGRKRSETGNANNVKAAFAEQSKMLERMQRIGSPYKGG